jgi:nicotinamidase-related amidase
MTDINPDNTALIVVDMQNDFCDPEGALYADPSGDAVEPVRETIEWADMLGLEIVYTKDVHAEDQFENTNYYNEFDRWGEHVLEGEWGQEIVDALEPDAFADYIVEKPTYSAFHETDLNEWLSDNDIDTVLVCGTLANVCVLHTASDAALRDYRPIVIEDAVGYITEDDKEYALHHAEWLFGELTTTDELR